MKKAIIGALACLFILQGCGLIRKSEKTSGFPDNSQTAPVKLPMPDRRPYSEDKGLPGPVAPMSEKVTERPEILFSELECSHVRIAGINPLPAGDMLELSLDELRDEFCYPLRGKFLSPFGMRGNSMHTGVDIKAQVGDTIRAAFPGVVRMSKLYSSYGNLVVIRHYAGFETLYSHNTHNLVNVNDVVEAGDPIAIAGRTGRATTEHLHFEVRICGEPVDPEKMLDVRDKMDLREGKLWLRRHNGRILAYNSHDEFESLAAGITKRESDDKKLLADAEKKSQGSSQGAVYYTVKKGDTLSAIAKRNSTTVKKICDLNNIKSTSLLRINQKLRVK